MERSSFIKALKAKKYFSYSSDDKVMRFCCGDVEIKIFNCGINNFNLNWFDVGEFFILF